MHKCVEVEDENVYDVVGCALSWPARAGVKMFIRSSEGADMDIEVIFTLDELLDMVEDARNA